MEVNLNTNVNTNFYSANAKASSEIGNKIEIQDTIKLDNEKISEEIIENINRISNSLNRKISFNINRDTNQVQIRVIDKETNEVIKVLPSEDLQKLHKNMKEAVGILGVLVDEEV